MSVPVRLAALALLACCAAARAQAFPHPQLVGFEPASADAFPLARAGHVAAIYLAPEDVAALGTPVEAFAEDVERVTGVKPEILHTLAAPLPTEMIVIGTAQSASVASLHLAVPRDWESALTTVVAKPYPGVAHALVVAGADRRGAAFALFTLSRQMGVSPWYWWADVPVPHHATVTVRARDEVQASPSVPYRGIFLNDEDWGLRPWAASKQDPALHNVGPHTYAHVFELLLRLHANSLWPAMHPGTLAFNAVAENAKLADAWGIVMGSSHSEALLRNNVGEWSEAAPPAGDGPWNYQTNRAAIDRYWDERLAANGKYENFYTVGMRGVHDTGLEATGSAEVKARLVEEVMRDQRALLAEHGNADVTKIPQVIWLYKESLELYRAGMQVPPDVTLGWTDDNYGYLRQLPTVEEQKRPGGSGIYYHVSYWGFPHDYLWLCTTPPALIEEEMTKAFDHHARRYWILNVGDLKPAEIDIDYFMQLAWNEPAMARISQKEFLTAWAGENFPGASASRMAGVLDRYYELNFIRKPEFMGFNGYNDGVNRTAFNPLGWEDQNRRREAAWSELQEDAAQLAAKIPAGSANAFFELVGYPVQAAAAMNAKFLFADRTFLDAHEHDPGALREDTGKAKAAYDRIQTLTAQYNSLLDGKWAGIMSAAPRERHVFEMPALATAADADLPLPAAWAPDMSHTTVSSAKGFVEEHGTVSIDAAHFVRKQDGLSEHWRVLPDLGLGGDTSLDATGAVVLGEPGLLANAASTAGLGAKAPWLDYEFTTVAAGAATLTLHLLPTFPVDSEHHLRYAVSVDGGAAKTFDLAGSGEWTEGSAPVWEDNVRRNSALVTSKLGELKPGLHTVRLLYVDPGVVFQHVVVTFPGAPPAYPVPPETRQ